MNKRPAEPQKKRIQHGRICLIDGVPIVGPATKKILQGHGLRSDSIFCGEMMTCLICGRVEKSDPRVETNWRAITADGQTYYFCPAEFPPDSAPSDLFKTAYQRCFAAILKTRAGEPLVEDIFRPVDWG